MCQQFRVTKTYLSRQPSIQSPGLSRCVNAKRLTTITNKEKQENKNYETVNTVVRASI